MNKLAFEQGFVNQCLSRGLSYSDTMELRKIASGIPLENPSVGTALDIPLENPSTVPAPGRFGRFRNWAKTKAGEGFNWGKAKADWYMNAGQKGLLKNKWLNRAVKIGVPAAALASAGYAMWPSGDDEAALQYQQQLAALAAQEQQMANQGAIGAGIGGLGGAALGYQVGNQYDSPYIGAALGGALGAGAGYYGGQMI